MTNIRKDSLEYRFMSLIDLVERIVNLSDRLALGELHDRRTA